MCIKGYLQFIADVNPVMVLSRGSSTYFLSKTEISPGLIGHLVSIQILPRERESLPCQTFYKYFQTGPNGSGIKRVSVLRSKQSILPAHLVWQSGSVGPIHGLWIAVSSALLQKNTLKMLVFSFHNKTYI